VRWGEIISLATLLLTSFSMWWVHEQEQIVDRANMKTLIDDVKQIRLELVEIERRLPR
jgi:hypothetical protein